MTGARWSTPQEAEALLATMRFCGAMTYLGDRPYSCCEEPGHAPPHRQSAFVWTDEDPIPQRAEVGP